MSGEMLVISFVREVNHVIMAATLEDSMSNQSLLALFRTTLLRFCSHFTCLFISMIEATLPNFRKIGQVFLEIRPSKKLKYYPKNCA